ncbi:PH domain-containing protein [Cellulomonas massiliensis]|uniref:PH domain-containing protein n=1 Tax=Cellulomonas massiliensis TaxID=1465811 RepID=UPI0002ED4BDB|nr:PH domain-containing protein [Cellulomonas massiliensis]
MTDGRAPLPLTFRPRLARQVSLAVALLVLVGTALVVVLVPGLNAGDRAGFLLFGVALAWFCWREASVRLVADEDGATVRNLIVTTRLQWADVVAVRFGERPWVQLDLANGETLAVMGIQRADGASAQEQARLLATLVAERTRTDRDD